VRFDGSGDATTIQGGLDLAAPGDTVLVGCGTYTDCTQMAIDATPACFVLPTSVMLRSESGDPDCVIVDAQGAGRVAAVPAANGPGRGLEGLTLAGGVVPQSYGNYGGGLSTQGGTEPLVVEDCVFRGNNARYGGGVALLGPATISRCLFLGNEAEQGGGAFTQAAIRFEDCVFRGNSAFSGGGLHVNAYSVEAERCLFSGNTAGFADPKAGGGAVYVFGLPPLFAGHVTLTRCTLFGNSWTSATGGGAGVAASLAASATLDRTIIAGSVQGASVYCYSTNASITASCTDVWWNAGGDWVGCIASQAGMNGNFSADPMFCASWTSDFRLATGSPCLPSNSPCQTLIGALDFGCAQPVGVSPPLEPSTWARIKGGYR
jgi:hypothetical protein